MKVHIKYFGMAAEAAGAHAETVELAQGSDLNALKALLVARHPKLGGMHIQFAVDKEIVGEAAVLQENSEIVLLPPFAGG